MRMPICGQIVATDQWSPIDICACVSDRSLELAPIPVSNAVKASRSYRAGLPGPDVDQSWSARASTRVNATTFTFGHLTPNVRLFAPSSGSLALGLVFGALKSLVFTLRSRPLAFVGEYLSVVCRLLAFVEIRSRSSAIRSRTSASRSRLAS
jgi:hypothetical protein